MKIRTMIAAGLTGAALTVAPIVAPEASAAVTVSGQVTCLNSQVQGVWIQAESSTSGFAQWYMPLQLGGLSQANYYFTLNRGGRYQVHVGCGGSRANWALDAKSGYVSGTKNNFRCNDIPWWLRSLGSAAMKRILGWRVDLTYGIPYGTCSRI